MPAFSDLIDQGITPPLDVLGRLAVVTALGPDVPAPAALRAYVFAEPTLVRAVVPFFEGVGNGGRAPR